MKFITKMSLLISFLTVLSGCVSFRGDDVARFREGKQRREKESRENMQLAQKTTEDFCTFLSENKDQKRACLNAKSDADLNEINTTIMLNNQAEK